MNFPDSFKIDSLKKAKPLEIFLFVIFILYIIIPFEIPYNVASFVNSSIGFVLLFIIAVSLFIYTNPILGVLYIIVAYELLRRSSVQPIFTSILQNTPSQEIKDKEMRNMNPPVHTTLEEEVIQVRAPIGRSSEIELIDSQFKPVSDKIISGSSLF